MINDISYKPLIEEFTWSYSRIKCFEQCKWQFFLKYIRGCQEEDTFFASYGSFMHEIIESYYTKGLTNDEMLEEFLINYQDKVVGRPPKNVKRESYLQKGIAYIESFKPFPYEMVAVEERINFDINGIPFVGFVDYLGEKDGEFYIVDNKSRDLKPRSGRATPTKSDEVLDDMLVQLYIYAHAVMQKYGKLPTALCFNCFKTQQFIIEPFDELKYQKALQWATESVGMIEDYVEFYEKSYYDYYQCSFLCGLQHDCEIWSEEEWR